MLLSSIFISLLACNNNETPQADVIHLEWSEGQEFHIAAKQRQIADKTVEGTVSLENYVEDSAFEERWTEEAIWTYKVVEVDFYPDANDELHLNRRGVSALVSLIKESIFRTRRHNVINSPRLFSNTLRGGPPRPV